jgi:hypothetical protein
MARLIKALKMDRAYPRIETLAVKTLLDREKNVIPNPILDCCAHGLLAFN